MIYNVNKYRNLMRKEMIDAPQDERFLIELIRKELSNNSIPIKQLIELKKEIDKALKILQDEMQENMIKELRQKAEANGISLESFSEKIIKEITPKPTKPETNKNPPKYKNPNSEETWSGYGRKPSWLKELLLSGKKLDDFKI